VEKEGLSRRIAYKIQRIESNPRNILGWASGIALESNIPSAKKKRYLKKGKSEKAMSKK